MAEPIEIIIRKGSGGEGTGFGISGAGGSGGRNTNFGNEEDFLKQKTGADKMLTATTALALATAKRAINYGISQYGNLTGHYIQQAELEMTLEAVGNVITVAGSTVTGTITGGIPGAIIGFVASTSNIAMTYGQQSMTLKTNISKLNTYANIMQDRANGIYSNESRGTYQ